MKKLLFLCFVALLSMQTNSFSQKIYSWGYNWGGSLGIGSKNSGRNLPGVISGANLEWKKISNGVDHFIAIKNDGTLWAWGNNSYGELGDGTNIEKTTPIQIGSDNNWDQVACALQYTLAIKTDGTLWAWGRNNFGQLGDGTKIAKNSPIQIGTEANWQFVATGSHGWGGSHTVAIKTDGSLWSWGLNDNGQLGDGTTIDKLVPTRIGTSTNWKFVDCGSFHTMALQNDGKLWVWGRNNEGQLGDGTNIRKLTPTLLGTSTWKVINLTAEFSLGIKNDGTLWATGNNAHGVLGDGTNTSKNIFTQIGTDNTWTDLTSGGDAYKESAGGMKTDGTIWGWGNNEAGQLGLGHYTSPQLSPVKIGTGTNWSKLNIGLFSSALQKINLVAPILVNPEDNSIDISNLTTFDWQTDPDAVKYKIQIATDSNFTNIKLDTTSIGTSLTLSTKLNDTTKYFWRVRSINGNLQGDWSNAFNFTTEIFTLYCKPIFQEPGQYMGINRIKFENIDNQTDWNNTTGFTYFKNLIANMNVGQNINFEVEFGNTYEMGLSIWVDWNRDEDFYDEGELVWSSGNQNSISGYSGNFIVPDSVNLGQSRIRFMSEYYYMNNSNPLYPCNEVPLYYGEAEDYTVNITDNPGVYSISAPTFCSNKEVEINFVAKHLNEDNTCIVEMSDETGSFANPTVVKSSFAVTSSGTTIITSPSDLIPGGNYKLRMKTSSPETVSEGYSVNIINGSAPTTQAKTLVFSTVKSTTMKLMWTNGNGNGRIILAKAGSSLTETPTDGMSYTASSVYGQGTAIGDAYVVYAGTSGNTLNLTGLAANTNYTFKVFEYNNDGICRAYNKNNGSLNPRSRKTAIAPPTLVENTDKGTNYLTARWTYSGTVQYYELCVATDTYFINMLANWNHADVGDLTEIMVEGLATQSSYYLRVRAYDDNGVAGEWSQTLSMWTLTNPTTTIPTNLTLSNVQANSFTANWASSTNNIVLLSTEAFNSTLVSGSKYVANLNYSATNSSTIGNAKVMYYVGGKTINIDGLTPNTKYYVTIFDYNGNIPAGYASFGTNALSGSITTISTEPTTVPSDITFSNTNSNSTKVNWTNGDGEKTLVIAKSANAGGGGGSLPTGYCTPYLPYNGNYYFTGTNINNGAINHSHPGAASNGYLNVTATHQVSVQIGQTIPFTLTTNQGSVNYAIWVDWNRDGDFNDANEKAYYPTTLNSYTSFSGSFVVPAGAQTGATRMRILGGYYYYFSEANGYSQTPCATNYAYYGKYVDYTINILGGRPQDGISYTANAQLGLGADVDGWKVVYSGTGSEVDVNGLDPLTEYSFRAFTYNGSNGTENYLSTYASGSVTTEANTPTIAPTNLTFSNIQATTSDMTWEQGNGTSTLIVASTSNTFTAPTNGSTYTVGSSLGTGVVVYNGTGNSGTATGLNPNTMYYYAAYTYNGTGSFTNYLNTPATANMHTLYAEPTTAPSGVSFTNVTTNSTDVTWTNGNGTNTLVYIYGGTWGSPADGMGYTADSDYTSTSSSLISNAKVVYAGTGNTFKLTGLNPNSNYQLRFFTFNGMSGLENYLTTSYATSNFTTLRKATKLVITNLSTNPIASGTAFSMTVQAQDANGMPAYNEEDITVGMTKTTGTGNFGGTTTMTLPSTANSVIFSNLVYTNNSGETGVALTASDLTTELTAFTYGNINVAPSTPTQDRAIMQGTRSQTSITISWSKGNGNGRIVAVAEGTLTGTPSDNTTYTANSTFGSGASLGNGYVVYNGTGTSVTVSGLVANTSYQFRVFAYNQAGSFIKYNTAVASMNPRSLTTLTRTAVAGNEPAETICDVMGTSINLGRIYPSPAINALNFDFTVTESNPVMLSIYDTEGKEVKTISNGTTYSAGTHQFNIDINELANGVYLLHAIQGECHSIQTFIINK